MENTGFKIEFRIFYFIHLPNEEDYERDEKDIDKFLIFILLRKIILK